MKHSTILSTGKYPIVEFDKLNDKITFWGSSVELYPETFYQKVTHELLHHITTTNCRQITIELNFSIMNTRSFRELVYLFKNVSQQNIDLTKIIVRWVYEAEDEDMLELGEDLFQLFPGIKIVYVENNHN